METEMALLENKFDFWKSTKEETETLVMGSCGNGCGCGGCSCSGG
jgi:hypothetical protein